MTHEPLPTLGKGTLGRKLVLQVAALVAACSVLLGLFMSVAAYRVLLSEVDSRLESTLARVGRVADPGTRPTGGAAGQQVGTVLVVFSSGGVPLSAGQVAETGWVTLDDSVITTLESAIDATTNTDITLPDDLGRYRVKTASTIGGQTMVVGIPLASLTQTMTSLIVLQAVLIVIVVTASVLIARSLVLRSLRPLNRLAATATHVSQLSLDRGEVSIAERVAEHDADPRTEVGRVGTAFNLMLNNVENALAVRQDSETRVRQFVADASHELRNPLASIRGYAELTRRERGDIPSGTRHALERIESEADRMSALVNDLLLLARLDTGPAIARTEVDASEIVLNAVADARAAGPHHNWTVDVPDDPVFLDADQNRLHQIVANLLTNARTHTPPGTTVHTSVTEGPDTVDVRVTDDGPGIPAELVGRVFERFTRAEASRVRLEGSSTGLGLAIVKAVVQAHNGQVRVESEPGVRTCFTITLPRTASSRPIPLLPSRPRGPDPQPSSSTEG